MKSQNECEPQRFASLNQKLEPYDLEVQQSDTKRSQQIKIKLQLNINQDNQILYYQDGEAIRIEEPRPDQTQQDVFTNLNQVQFLRWHGEYGPNGKKTDYWYASWNGSILNQVGGYSQLFSQILYYEEGFKIGIWNQLFQNYQNSNKIYEIGEYFQNKKIGHWKYLQNDNLIAGGYYDEQGNEFKVGKWIDLDDGFDKQKLVIYDGEYINGKKVGNWKIWFDQNGIKNNIGGGAYDQGVKVGYWIDLSDGFNYQSQVIYNGVYQNGKRVGRWDIKFLDEQIGGGLYDQEGQGVKIGQWTESSDGFKSDSRITYIGEYKNGVKVGRWEIKQDGTTDYDDEYQEDFEDIQSSNIEIGGGLYDQEGQGVKIGQWIDVSDAFDFGSQVIYNGQYLNGKKFGSWDIEYKDISMFGFYEKIGGGSYDQEGQGVKIGKWIDVSDEYKWNSQLIYVGEYKYGKKVGSWEIQFRKSNGKEFKKIGVGSYDEVGQELKIGQWIIVDRHYSDDSQVTYHGEYKNGNKFGRWDFWLNYNDLEQKSKKIGGGSYDESGQGVKTGQWIDISDQFASYFQLTQIGEYKQGRKVGRWDIWYMEEAGIYDFQFDIFDFSLKKDRDTKENQKIGGGYYDIQDQGLKIGLWIDISDQFKKYEQVIYKGEYKNGKKVGIWEVLKRDQNSFDEGFELQNEIQYDK